jgi:starch phosphorylase
MEASGTSGMKAALNGVLNCSILDGWWDEAFANGVGWAIGRGETYANPDQQDDIESAAMYDLFEKQIIPMFYDRDPQGIPRQWVATMKQCIATLAPAFNTNRMVQEYTEKLYLPALRRARSLGDNNLAKAIELARLTARLRAHWGNVRVENVQADLSRPIGVYEKLPIEAVVNIDGLEPADIRVQAYTGLMDNDGKIVCGKAVDLKHAEDLGGHRHRFVGEIGTETSGRYGFAVRIVPGGEFLIGTREPGLIRWEGEAAPVRTTAAKPALAAAH